LPSLGLDETLAFYREVLGFDRIIYQSPDYLMSRRNEMELHFRARRRASAVRGDGRLLVRR